MDDEILARIEKQRLQLEDNVAKLRKSLRHWQTLEIDYEGLKEEFQILPEDATQEECLQAAKDFKPELIDDKELRSMLEERGGNRKRPSQLVDILSKRIDYVTRNISTVRKQLLNAEKKRNALLLAQDVEHQDDAGLPLSEITEELDEEGHVISSKVQAPGNEAPDLLEVLRRAGISDIKNGRDSPEAEADRKEVSEAKLSDNKVGNEVVSKRPQSTSTSSAEKRDLEFSEDEEVSSDEGKFGPTNPNDSEAEAALRQEMLRYGLGEVGAIVAELDLEDSTNLSYDEDDDGDYLSDYDEDEDLYTDESEDEKGATKNPIISERYKRQMEALSKKHGVTDLENLGPEPELPNDMKEQPDRPSAAEAAGKAAIARNEANKSVLKSKGAEDIPNDEPQKKKKKVAFAPSLDIAQETQSQEAPAAKSPASEPTVNPMEERVIERTTDDPDMPAPPSTQPPKPLKISKFKAARSAAPPTPMFPPPTMDFPTSSTSKPTPSGPPGRTISNTLVERPASQITAPLDPDDFDEEIHKREVAIEYQKMRNRRIHEQGGYVQGGEQENYGEDIVPEPVLDENTGRSKKVSRFKAARLKS